MATSASRMPGVEAHPRVYCWWEAASPATLSSSPSPGQAKVRSVEDRAALTGGQGSHSEDRDHQDVGHQRHGDAATGERLTISRGLGRAGGRRPP